MDDGERLQKSRQIYEEANKSMRSCEEKEERLMLLESWSDFERDFGSEATMEKVRRLMPKKVKKRRKLTAEDGVRRLFLCHFLSGAVSHFLSEHGLSCFSRCSFPVSYHDGVTIPVYHHDQGSLCIW